MYPSTSKFARRGNGIGNRVTPLPAMPTMAMPGTPEKIEVLTERFARGETLWHPKDAPVCPLNPTCD